MYMQAKLKQKKNGIISGLNLYVSFMSRDLQL